jgi:hypothetical protein
VSASLFCETGIFGVLRMEFVMKKIFSIILTFAIMAACVPFAFADDPMVDITFRNADMFAVGLDVNETFEYEVVGLTSSGEKVPITDSEYVTWEIDDENVVTWFNHVDPTGSVTAKIVAVDYGNAVVTVTYDDGEGNVFSVYSTVAVQSGPSPTPATVTDIDVTVDGISVNFDLSGLDVPYFTLKEVYNDPDYPDSAVLTTAVTALHALLFALEKEVYPTFDATTSWQWVPNNVVITNNGAYVYSIGTDVNNWVYTVNGSSPGAACQKPLEDEDVEVWTFLRSPSQKGEASLTNGLDGLSDLTPLELR